MKNNAIGRFVATAAVIAVVALCGAFEPILLVFVAPAGMATIRRIWVTDNDGLIESASRKQMPKGSNDVTRWLRDGD